MKKVYWDTWFSVAACVYLGCPYEGRNFLRNINAGDHGSHYVAIQYGNLSVIAPWLDQTTEMKMQHLFGLIQGKGTIGVVRNFLGQEDTFRFQGKEDTIAIVEIQRTEDTNSFTSRFQKGRQSMGSTLVLEDDRSEVDYDMILASTAENKYRLLFRVRSEHHSRMVDPSFAIIRLAGTVSSTECKHRKSSEQRQAILLQDSYVYPFDEALGRWGNHGISPAGESDEELLGTEEVLHVSQILDSRLKFNIAVALADSDALVMNDGRACFSCVQAQVKSTPAPDYKQDQLSRGRVTRIVVNMYPNLRQTAVRANLKRKAIDGQALLR